MEKLTKKQEWFKSREKHWKRKLQVKEKELAEQSKQADSLDSGPRGGGVPGQSRTQGGSGCGEGRGGAEPRLRQDSKVSIPANSRTEGVLFVPHTPESLLAKMLQKEEDTFFTLHQCAWVKVVERGGTRLQDLLGRKDPWAKTSCGKSDCMVCEARIKPKGGEEAPTACCRENVCYEICCDRCKLDKIDAHYYGESARTGYLRGREHLRGQAGRQDENPMWKHDQVHHQGVQGSLQHENPADPQGVTRQIQEATKIECTTAQVILNSRSEYNGQKVPRVMVEVGGKVDIKEYRGSGVHCPEETNFSLQG